MSTHNADYVRAVYREALHEIMRQASYLPRWSPERRRIEDAASDALRALPPAHIDGSGASG